MIVGCPNCGAGHAVPVSKLADIGEEIVCRKCGTVFSAKQAAANPAGLTLPDVGAVTSDLAPSTEVEEEDEAFVRGLRLEIGHQDDEESVPGAGLLPGPSSSIEARVAAGPSALPSTSSLPATGLEQAGGTTASEVPGARTLRDDHVSAEPMSGDPASLEPTIAGERIPEIKRELPMPLVQDGQGEDERPGMVASAFEGPTTGELESALSRPRILLTPAPDHGEAADLTPVGTTSRKGTDGSSFEGPTLAPAPPGSFDSSDLLTPVTGTVRALPSRRASQIGRHPVDEFRDPRKPEPLGRPGSVSRARPGSAVGVRGAAPVAPYSTPLGTPLDPELPPQAPVVEAGGSKNAILVGGILGALGLFGGLIAALTLPRGVPSSDPMLVPPTAVAGPARALPAGVKMDPRTAQESSAAPAPSQAQPRGSFAPQGHAYVGRPVRLRERIGGRPQTRLEAGFLVRRLVAQDGWVLVLVEPRGPAGFVEADALEDQKPIVSLALERAFAGCLPVNPTCLSGARRQRARCLERCVNEDVPLARCESACRMAFEKCRSGCRRTEALPTE